MKLFALGRRLSLRRTHCPRGIQRALPALRGRSGNNTKKVDLEGEASRSHRACGLAEPTNDVRGRCRPSTAAVSCALGFFSTFLVVRSSSLSLLKSDLTSFIWGQIDFIATTALLFSRTGALATRSFLIRILTLESRLRPNVSLRSRTGVSRLSVCAFVADHLLSFIAQLTTRTCGPHSPEQCPSSGCSLSSSIWPEGTCFSEG